MKSYLRRYTFIFITIPCFLFLPSVFAQSLQSLEVYRPLSNNTAIVGSIRTRGSTRIAPFINDWVKLFRKHYPQITFDIESSGSRTGPVALLNGVANIAAMSRPISQKEIEKFQAEKGYLPVGIRIARDAVVVHINRVNLLASLSIPELDAIFSVERKCNYPKKITHWNMLGNFSEEAIEVHLLHSAAGASGLFQERALCFGDYQKVETESLITGSEMVAAIAKSPEAIGFSGLGTANPDTKMLALSQKQGFPSYAPTRGNIASGDYPLSRYLYLYIDQPPNVPMPVFLREFFMLILSREGQEVVANHQAVILPPRVVSEELDILEQYK